MPVPAAAVTSTVLPARRPPAAADTGGSRRASVIVVPSVVPAPAHRSRSSGSRSSRRRWCRRASRGTGAAAGRSSLRVIVPAAMPSRSEHVDRELAERAVEVRPEQLVDRSGGADRSRLHQRQRAQRVVAHDPQRDPRVGEPLAHDRIRRDAGRRAPASVMSRSSFSKLSCWPSVDAPRSNASVPIATRQPPFDLADDVVGGGASAVEERLVELAVAGDLHDRADLDAGLVHRHQQVRQALVLRRVAVGAAQHEDPLRPVRERRPHLLARARPTRRRRERRVSARSRGRSRRSAPSSPGTRSRCRAGSRAGTRCFWSSRPKCTIVGPSRPSPTMPTRPGPPARAYSSKKITCSTSVTPRPPYSAGQPSPIQPSRPSSCSHSHRSSNNSCSSPGPPRPRTSREPTVEPVRSHARASARKQSCAGVKRRSKDADRTEDRRREPVRPRGAGATCQHVASRRRRSGDAVAAVSRRDFLAYAGRGAVVLATVGAGATFLTACDPLPLQPPDANGLRLPKGFTSRRIATSGVTVPGTSYTWHSNPDGGACFPLADGGWSYVSNSESIPGGAGFVRFDQQRHDRRGRTVPRPGRSSTAPAARRRGERG